MKCRAGFVGFGEVNTPREVIEKKCREAKQLLEGIGLELVPADPVSDDEQGLQAGKAVYDLKLHDFDFLVVCISGWIPSYAILTVIYEFKDKPLLLWSLAGEETDGRLLTTAAQAGMAAIRKPLKDMGFTVKSVCEFPGAQPKLDEISAFVNAIKTVNRLKRSKVGMMGYRDMKLYGTMFDGVSLRAKIGVEVEFFEMLEIAQTMESIPQGEVDRITDKVRMEWEFQGEPDEMALKKSVRVYLALKEKIVEKNYDAVSLIDVDGMKKLLKLPPSMIFMLISNELKKCTIPENDTLGAVTQLITKYATGQISAYMEIYEFMQDRVLFGVPDYVPGEIIDGVNKVIPASFGHISEGILNVSKIKTGRVTLARLGSCGDKYEMHIVTGNAVSPRSWEEVGWKQPAPQLPSLEIIIDTSIKDFMEKVISQHYIITYGDNTVVLKEICGLLKIDVI